MLNGPNVRLRSTVPLLTARAQELHRAESKSCLHVSPRSDIETVWVKLDRELTADALTAAIGEVGGVTVPNSTTKQCRENTDPRAQHPGSRQADGGHLCVHSRSPKDTNSGRTASFYDTVVH